MAILSIHEDGRFMQGVKIGRIHFLCFCLLAASQAFAQIWRSDNLQLLHGYGFSDRQEQSTLTLEHAQGAGPVSLFLFLDAYHRPKPGFSVYGEFYGYLSLSALTGVPLSIGPLKDVSIDAGINAGADFRDKPFKAWLHGLTLDFAVPGFEFFQINFNAYKQENAPDYGVQITPVWSIPFEIGPVRCKFRGYLDWTSGNALPTRHWYLLTQPQFLIDLGHFFQADNRFYIGVEYHRWEHKYGIKGFRESSPQMMMLLNF
jgi:nucleoside-specific outer membrane channel protein Tsx